MRTVPDGGPVGELAEPPVDRSATPATYAALRPVDELDAVALAQGYTTHASQLMRDGATALDLAIPDAAAWLDIHVTPWAAEVWMAEGFGDASEAREHRRWGFSPRHAHLARRDGLTASSLREHRRLFHVLARSPELP